MPRVPATERWSSGLKATVVGATTHHQALAYAHCTATQGTDHLSAMDKARVQQLIQQALEAQEQRFTSTIVSSTSTSKKERRETRLFPSAVLGYASAHPPQEPSDFPPETPAGIGCAQNSSPKYSDRCPQPSCIDGKISLKVNAVIIKSFQRSEEQLESLRTIVAESDIPLLRGSYASRMFAEAAHGMSTLMSWWGYIIAFLVRATWLEGTAAEQRGTEHCR
ncbi:hypothetical protein V8F33_014085 [Rhypophila sp. PSN 637]